MSVRTLFLPGASGAAAFWRPAAERSSHAGRNAVFLNWPGLGDEPPHPDVNGFDDLVAMVLAHMDEPVNIVAQSMGGVVAMRAALAAPRKINRLVLAVTSGGMDVAALGGSQWRADYARRFPRAAAWIVAPVEDLSARLPSIEAPALLLWGDRDPISPVAVGRRLAALLPRAVLHVVAGGDHDLAVSHAAHVAELIDRHLADDWNAA